AFFGWQRLRDKATIQGALEDALHEALGVPTKIMGSGRTDRGAHAEGQVFNARIEPVELLPADDELPAFLEQLNHALPDAIAVLDVTRVPADFHARESATGKVYRYEIFNGPQCPAELEGRVWHIPEALTVDVMADALQIFVGELDFASFATKPGFTQRSTRRNLRRAELEQDGARISIVLEADGFLYKMVRNIVRAV